jgi:hypothetical protein
MTPWEAVLVLGGVAIVFGIILLIVRNDDEDWFQ